MVKIPKNLVSVANTKKRALTMARNINKNLVSRRLKRKVKVKPISRGVAERLLKEGLKPKMRYGVFMKNK